MEKYLYKPELDPGTTGLSTECLVDQLTAGPVDRNADNVMAWRSGWLEAVCEGCGVGCIMVLSKQDEFLHAEALSGFDILDDCPVMSGPPPEVASV